MRPSLTTLAGAAQLSSPRDATNTVAPMQPSVNKDAAYKAMLLAEMNKNKDKNKCKRKKKDSLKKRKINKSNINTKGKNKG